MMSFMRLGTRIAVINGDNEILLSKRGDFGLWALPGGRVDSGELLHESAIREVQEETGLIVEIERPIGLYYQQGRSRMNILYRAKPVGGELVTVSDETLDNRFFPPNTLPDDLFGRVYIDHAFSQETHCHAVETSRWELLKLDLKLRQRWIQNLLAGRPEPKFNQFKVRAVAVVWHDGKVFAQQGKLPSVLSDGHKSLVDALSQKLQSKIDWRWLGIWQDPTTDTMDFIFQAEQNLPNGEWRLPADLDEHQQQYLQKSESVWHIP